MAEKIDPLADMHLVTTSSNSALTESQRMIYHCARFVYLTAASRPVRGVYEPLTYTWIALDVIDHHR